MAAYQAIISLQQLKCYGKCGETSPLHLGWLYGQLSPDLEFNFALENVHFRLARSKCSIITRKTTSQFHIIIMG